MFRFLETIFTLTINFISSNYLVVNWVNKSEITRLKNWKGEKIYHVCYMRNSSVIISDSMDK